ncbi:unnamed protein product [Plutella xylostella]|uniref:(diamondback moth) hypothetical protein n=1 Tax=Plutella xylostella TaxID=51655 RepID=A0A8S4F4K5_PLUXY|nr:unnamed protein product [Plutella xylostella]
MFDAANTCRACIKSNVTLIGLFEPWHLDHDGDGSPGSAGQLADALTLCTTALVAKEDGLPQSLCQDCIQKLEIAYSFRTQVLKSEFELRKSFLLQSSIKNEPTDIKAEESETLDDYTTDFDFIQDESPKVEISCNDEGDTCLQDSTKTFECHKCEKQYKSEARFIKHLSSHEKQKFECKKCNKSFRKQSTLDRHTEKHESEHEAHVCTLCNQSYSQESQLVDHMLTHTDNIEVKTENESTENKHKCPECFTQLCNLKDHTYTHTGETPYLCSECGKGFNNSSNLRQHIMRHTGVKPFTCSLCPKKFTTKGQMTSHLLTHSGAHPHKCTHCGAAFTKPQSLKKHELIHLGVKPFQCDACPMR